VLSSLLILFLLYKSYAEVLLWAVHVEE